MGWDRDTPKLGLVPSSFFKIYLQTEEVSLEKRGSSPNPPGTTPHSTIPTLPTSLFSTLKNSIEVKTEENNTLSEGVALLLPWGTDLVLRHSLKGSCSPTPSDPLPHSWVQLP